LDLPETDTEGNIRTLSIASSPAENDLMVATRIRDTAFKRVLKTMPLGSELRMDGPLGSFTLYSNASRPAVLLVGGIGITPFRSMIVNAAREGFPRRVTLFYSNRQPEDCAFLQELQQIGSGSKNYHTLCAITKMENSSARAAGRPATSTSPCLLDSSRM